MTLGREYRELARCAPALPPHYCTLLWCGAGSSRPGRAGATPGYSIRQYCHLTSRRQRAGVTAKTLLRYFTLQTDSCKEVEGRQCQVAVAVRFCRGGKIGNDELASSNFFLAFVFFVRIHLSYVMFPQPGRAGSSWPDQLLLGSVVCGTAVAALFLVVLHKSSR